MRSRSRLNINIKDLSLKQSSTRSPSKSPLSTHAGRKPGSIPRADRDHDVHELLSAFRTKVKLHVPRVLKKDGAQPIGDVVRHRSVGRVPVPRGVVASARRVDDSGDRLLPAADALLCGEDGNDPSAKAVDRVCVGRRGWGNTTCIKAE